MVAIVAIISFVLSVIFYLLDLGHGHWTWTLFALLGLLFMAIAGKWDR